jgi:hypothetical protein
MLTKNKKHKQTINQTNSCKPDELACGLTGCLPGCVDEALGEGCGLALGVGLALESFGDCGGEASRGDVF